MAAFPTLTPSAAPITPGAWPVATIGSLNGAESRTRQGSAQIGRRLQLTFTNVTEANFLAILNHYRGQRSGFDSFGFDPTTLAADLTPAGYAWLYASRPQVVDEHADVFTVVCEFKAEPRGLVVAIGKAWRSAQTSLTRNVAPGVQWVNGQSTFLPGTGARFAAGSRWETSTVFAPQSSSMGVAWATSATTLTAGARSERAPSDGVLWATSATTLYPQARISSGTVAPLLGAVPATSFVGWTRAVNANGDDTNVSFGSWPFTFYLAGTGYTACFPGSNGYATFGSDSSNYGSLSASNPAFPKLMFGAGDLSWQRLYRQTGNGYARFRWEGHSTTFGATPGTSTRIVEVTFWQSDGVFQLIEVRTGNFASPGSTQPFMVASASTAYASATTLGANQSWVFKGNADGTSWTLFADSYVVG
jgi:hypothetical protein